MAAGCEWVNKPRVLTSPRFIVRSFWVAIFIVAAYAVACESSGNDYKGVSQDDKGCKSQTLNSLNESYVGCIWALAIAKVTDSESDTDIVWWWQCQRRRHGIETLDWRIMPSCGWSFYQVNWFQSSLMLWLSCSVMTWLVTSHNNNNSRWNESVIHAMLLPLTVPDDMTWSGWCGIMIIMLVKFV